MAKLKHAVVTTEMKKAGAAALRSARKLPVDDLVTVVYRAMHAACAILELKTRAIEHDIGGAFIIEWPPVTKSQKRKKRPPSRRKAALRRARVERPIEGGWRPSRSSDAG